MLDTDVLSTAPRRQVPSHYAAAATSPARSAEVFLQCEMCSCEALRDAQDLVRLLTELEKSLSKGGHTCLQ